MNWCESCSSCSFDNNRKCKFSFEIFVFIQGIWKHFWMSKYTFMDICNQMRPLISKHDTRYRKASPIEICISCVMYKIAQGKNTLTCSELFAIGWSFVALVICKVVMAINSVFRKLITWPMGDKMQVVNWVACLMWWVL
jgi:hypothetical protein